MSLFEIILLLVTGLVVGLINTLAGGATIISLSVLMFLGLPPNVANATHRIAALFQTFVSTSTFRKEKVLDFKKALYLGIPTAFGSLIGAYIAVDINEKVFERAVGFVMIIMLFFIIYKPQYWLKGKEKLVKKKLSIWQIILFFLLGIYGGFIHIGIGYFLLAAIVLSAGYDLVKANAIKVMIVFIYVLVTLVVFFWYNLIDFKYGLTLAVGQAAGAFIGVKVAVKWGTNFIRWLMIVIIIILSLHFFDIINLKDLLNL